LPNFAAVVLYFFAIDACIAQAPSSNPMTIPLTTIQKGNFSGIREPLQVVVRTQDEWNNLWKRHASIQSPPSPLPVVNFTTEMVVGIFAGEKTTGGYEAEITSAELKDSSLYVYYVEKSSTPGGMAIQALTQPFHLAKLPRYELPIVFVKGSP
jgi:hypothetical protein